MKSLSTVREIIVRFFRGVSFQLAVDRGFASWKLTPLVAWLTAIGFPLVLWQAWAISCAAAEARNEGAVSPPTYRVETEGFDASEADIRAVLDSASRGLWQHFPDCRIEPFVVTRGRSGPITLHQRNERGEIVMRLDAGKTYWAQYAYQFAHEFCHILC